MSDEEADDTGPRSRGRPRNAELDEAIIRATIDRLAEDGYTRMSMGDIAADAGTTRPTLYRRWQGKRELVADVLDLVLRKRLAQQTPVDVHALPAFEAVKQTLYGLDPSHIDPRELALLGNILAESTHIPELLEIYREHCIEPGMRLLADTLSTLQQRGDLRPDIDPDDVATMLYGSYLGDHFRSGTNTPDLATRAVSLLWPAIESEKH